MAVEAGRIALRTDRSGAVVERMTLSTVTPPHLEKTNATAIHADLRLDPSATAVEVVGAVRSGIDALHSELDAAAAGRTTLATFADVREFVRNTEAFALSLRDTPASDPAGA